MSNQEPPHPAEASSRRSSKPHQGAAADAIRLPPHNDELEHAVLGAIFLDSRYYFAVRPMMRRTTFWRNSNRLIWDEVLRICEAGGHPDTITVADSLRSKGLLEEVGGASTIARLSMATPSGLNAVQHAQRLVELEQLRDLQVMTLRAHETTGEDSDPLDVAEGLRVRINGVLSRAGHTKWTDAETSANKWLENYRRRQAGEETRYVRTNLPWLDTMLGGGIIPTYSYYLGGIYKAGKSKVTQSIAIAMLRAGWTVDWWSCEMPDGELTQRSISAIGGISETELADPAEGAMLPGFEQALLKAHGEWAGMKDRFRTRLEGQLPVREIVAETTARAMLLQGGGAEPPPYMLVVDYLQKCDAGLGLPMDDSKNISAASSAINGLAKDLNIPVLIVYQINARKVDARRKGDMDYMPPPRHVDAHGSTAIQMDANELLMVHRPFADHEDESLRSFMTFDRGLARSGSRKMRYLRADLEHNQIAQWNEEPPHPFGK